MPFNPSTPEDWTVAGVVLVEGLRVSGDSLRIEARRLHLGWLTGGFQELHDHVSNLQKSEKEDRSLRIEADLGSATAEAAEAALSQIFLTSKDNFTDLVPDYWKACVASALTPATSEQGRAKAGPPTPSCHLSPDFLAIPGIAYNPASHVDTQTNSEGTGAVVSYIGHGITPPKALSQHDPEFSDEARRAHYQGTVVLGLVVDKSGTPTNISILTPIGAGLDAKAVKVVKGWRFQPATKDGEPVAVQIAVEVDFHLY